MRNTDKSAFPAAAGKFSGEQSSLRREKLVRDTNLLDSAFDGFPPLTEDFLSGASVLTGFDLTATAIFF